MPQDVLSGLDPRTLIAVLTLVHLGNLVFSLFFFWGKRKTPGASSWIWGQAMVVIASGLLPWMGRSLGPAILIVLPNTFYYLSSLFLLDAVWQFRFAKPMPRLPWATALLFSGGFAALILGGGTVNTRIAYYSAWMGAASLGSSLVLVHGMDRRLRLPAYLAAATFLAPIPFHLMRGIQALSSPPWVELGIQDPSQAAFYLVSIFTAYLLLLAFVLLSSMRQTLELKDLNQTQLVMLQVIAHDLRNPIGSAARYVRKHLVPEGVDLGAKREAIKVLGRTLSETDALLENLLAWANDRMGIDRKPRLEDLDLDAVLELPLSLVDEAAREKGIAIEAQASGLHILAEANGAALVLRNLISNALKFTPSGGRVWVEARHGGGRVEVTIGDTGLGLDAERLKAFSLGQEVPSSPGTAGERGSGLGLSLCKRMMEAQGGRLELESHLGQGSVFTLVFPAPEA